MKWLRGILTSPPALIGGFLTVLWLVVGLLAPFIAPLDPIKSYIPLQFPGAPSLEGGHFWLGTDMLGRDVLSRLIWGTRTVLIWSCIATAAAFSVGIAAGLVAGFYRGRVDDILSFLANAILSFPVLVLYVVIIVALGASGTNIVLAVTFASAPAIYRLVRALTIDLRSRDYVQAAITQGEGDLRIMLSEILPNALRPVMVDLCLRLGYTAATIGVLGFLASGCRRPPRTGAGW